MSRAIDFGLRVDAERERQDARFGVGIPSLDLMATVLGEEFGEVCRAILEMRECAKRGEVVAYAVHRANLEEELVQVAAVCRRVYEHVQLEVSSSAEPSRCVRCENRTDAERRGLTAYSTHCGGKNRGCKCGCGPSRK